MKQRLSVQCASCGAEVNVGVKLSKNYCPACRSPLPADIAGRLTSPESGIESENGQQRINEDEGTQWKDASNVRQSDITDTDKRVVSKGSSIENDNLDEKVEDDSGQAGQKRDALDVFFYWAPDGKLGATIKDVLTGKSNEYPVSFVKPANESVDDFCSSIATMLEHEFCRPINFHKPANERQPTVRSSRKSGGSNSLYRLIIPIACCIVVVVLFVLLRGAGQKEPKESVWSKLDSRATSSSSETQNTDSVPTIETTSYVMEEVQEGLCMKVGADWGRHVTSAESDYYPSGNSEIVCAHGVIGTSEGYFDASCDDYASRLAESYGRYGVAIDKASARIFMIDDAYAVRWVGVRDDKKKGFVESIVSGDECYHVNFYIDETLFSESKDYMEGILDSVRLENPRAPSIPIHGSSISSPQSSSESSKLDGSSNSSGSGKTTVSNVTEYLNSYELSLIRLSIDRACNDLMSLLSNKDATEIDARIADVKSCLSTFKKFDAPTECAGLRDAYIQAANNTVSGLECMKEALVTSGDSTVQIEKATEYFNLVNANIDNATGEINRLKKNLE